MHETQSLADLAPTDCLVVEDSLAGIVSAKSAGMWAVGVPNTYTAQQLLEAGADDVILGLADLTPSWIDRRFASIRSIFSTVTSSQYAVRKSTRSRGMIVPCDKASSKRLAQNAESLACLAGSASPGCTCDNRPGCRGRRASTRLAGGAFEPAIVGDRRFFVLINLATWSTCCARRMCLVNAWVCIVGNPFRPLFAWQEACAASNRSWCRASCSTQTWRAVLPLLGPVVPWVIGGLRVAERQKRWHLTLDRLTAPLGNGSVCVSQGVLRFSRDIARLDPARLTVIPNGIEIAPFDAAMPVPRAELGIPDHVHVALYVGRLDQQKGLPDLLDAAEQVISKKPDWHLALAGDGPCRDWLLQQIANRTALRGKVHWLGHRDDIPNVLKSADVLVHPSLWEGMPNSVLEAMAAGLAVIGTAVEGTEDLVVPGPYRLASAPARCLNALARALLEAAESPEWLDAYGRAGS